MLERIEKIPVPLVPNIGFCCVTHKAWYIITLLNATQSRSSISVNVQHSGSVTLLKSCTMKNLFSTAKKKKKKKRRKNTEEENIPMNLLFNIQSQLSEGVDF